MTSRQRFLNAFTGNSPDRPPVWIMRQAGRYLPEYRKLKESYDFVTMVSTPDLATEVTLQPLKRFPQLDAAIIFSDILIVPEAMGMPYAFRESGGIEMAWQFNSKADLERLSAEPIAEKTAYLPAAIRQVRAAVGANKAVLGFGGSPWTLATYMIEGGSSKDFSRSRACFREQPELFHALMEQLCTGLITLFRSQIDAGVDAIQIFDSWASATPPEAYSAASLSWIHRIIAALPKGFPIILFAKGMGAQPLQLLDSGAMCLAADPSVDLAAWRACLPPETVIQGNLAPEYMAGEPATAAAATRSILDIMRPWHRYIFNLGHGITPNARIDTVEAVLDTIAQAGKPIE